MSEQLDLRTAHFFEIRASLTGKRLAVYDQMLAQGPSTPKEIADRMGWDVTSVRPRITELKEILHVEPTGRRRNDEHEFRALPTAHVQMKLEQIQRDGAKNQKTSSDDTLF